MSNPKHVLTNMCRDLHNKHDNRYQQVKQYKTYKYYLLYIDQIIHIQRYFRQYLLRKGKKLQIKVLGNLRRKAELERINQENKIELMLLRKRRRDVKIADENQVAVTLRDRKRVRLESCIDSTIDTAFQMAQNHGRVKCAMAELRQMQNRTEQLEGQVAALQFEQNCHNKRRLQWDDKLKQLRGIILVENAKKRQLVAEIMFFNTTTKYDQQ